MSKVFGKKSIQGLQDEGGVFVLSAGIRVYMSPNMGCPVAFDRYGCHSPKQLYGRRAPKATKNKIDFAKTWASLVDQGRVYVLRRDWTEDLLSEM